MRSTSAGISVAVHLGAVAIMSFLGATAARQRFTEPARVVVPLIYHAPVTGAPGGGGSNDPLPPRKGALPPAPAQRIFVPPMMMAANPKLPVSAALIDAPDTFITAEAWGDPLAKAGIGGGTGTGGGFGKGCCGGVGDGDGPRAGVPGGGPAVVGRRRLSSGPRVLYKIDPEYPDEARKARFQGVVVLVAEVDEAGRTGRIRVMRGLGLGMDERAIEAVEKWKFAPALEQGKPVPAPVTIEVSFRLL